MLHLSRQAALSIAFALTTVLANAKAIDTTQVVTIGGIKQFISIKGSDDTHPLLLVLHGGPGKSLIPMADKFTDKLLQHYVVVQWDQREAGETFKLNPSPVPLTVKRFEDDTYELVQYLLKTQHREKLYLFAHSWGTVLGFYMADKHPELLHAYIAMSPLTDQLQSERLTIALLQKDANEKHNTIEQKELATIQVPFRNTEQLYHYAKWLFLYNGVDFVKDSSFRPQYLAWAATWLPVWNDACKRNLFQTLKRVNCPVYFFLGVGDNQTFYTLSEKYFKTLQAPKKELVWFKESGHTIFNTEPGKLQDMLIDKVLQGK